ncbi:hypothetical protein K1T71_009843 [Dendrolimus kikuchii]|uniref:Uncharacterized protein n=1 Tax=Dendrolimus kikuchii TaxID=765133 RepID=A0ACC1CSZ9_9NEOP|nr:hypothetical protein K1T71_009843 [Dendrolimus kikuchii]
MLIGPQFTKMIPDIPESITQGHLAQTKMSAYELHKAMLKIFLCKGIQSTDDVTTEQIDRLLKEYAYRGSNISYTGDHIRKLQ